MRGDILTFNTITYELKKEISSTVPFDCHLNQSANVDLNTLVALVEMDYGSKKCLIKYTKGDTAVTILHTL